MRSQSHYEVSENEVSWYESLQEVGNHDSRVGVALIHDSHLLVVIDSDTAFPLCLAALGKEIRRLDSEHVRDETCGIKAVPLGP